MRTSSCVSLGRGRALPSDLDRHLFVYMLKEEWRLHKSLIGPTGSAFFPVFIFGFSAGLAVLVPMFLSGLSYSALLLMFHVASVMYGLFVGSIGHIGEEIWSRRLGQINVILQLPQILPLSFKRVMVIFYLKDALYYVLYTFAPFTLGIAVASPLAEIAMGSVAQLCLTMVLTFMMGMSLSFLLSATAVRSRRAAGVIGLSVLGLASLVWPLNILSPGQLLLPLGYWYTPNPILLISSIVVTLVFSTSAVSVIRERFEAAQRRHRSVLLEVEPRFSFMGRLSALVAKEWVELSRSGVMKQVVLGLAGTLLGVYFIIWLIETGLGFHFPFNVVSYSGFVGFMGVLTYSWITAMEHNESLNALPVSVDEVVEAKLILYLILTAGISAGCVALISLAKNEVSLLALGLLVAGANAVYAGSIAARLTGLWTNTMFFDAKVIGKFAAAVAPPLLVVESASLWIQIIGGPVVYVIAAVSIVQVAASIIMLRGVRERWRGASFAFAITEA